MQCEACSHVFTDGYWTPEALAILFGRTHENQKPGHDYERHRYGAARLIDRVCGEGVEPGDLWLDVGFGNGALLFTASEFGFKTIGLDLRQSTVDAMNAIGIEARCCAIEDIEARVEVISMCDVLEHMAHPKKGLEAARQNLRPGGILLLSMPNMDSPLWGLMDARNDNDYWDEIEHHHNFGRERLFRLLSDTGFTPIRYGVSERYRCCMEVIASAA